MEDGLESPRRAVLRSTVFLNLKLVLDPVLVMLGRSPPRYQIFEGGEAVVTVETRTGVRTFSSDNNATSDDGKKWLAVSRALEVILAEEGMEVRDPTHVDLAWTAGLLKSHENARAEFRNEVKELENRILRTIVENQVLREDLRDGRT